MECLVIRRRKVPVGVAVASAFTIVAARGETLRETLDQFGFFGTWAIALRRAGVARAMSYAPLSSLELATPSSAKRSAPNSEPNIYVILRAKRTARAHHDPHQAQRRDRTGTHVRHEQDRVRTVDNREVASGQYVVRDGVVTSNQSETPWLTRCGETARTARPPALVSQ